MGSSSGEADLLKEVHHIITNLMNSDPALEDRYHGWELYHESTPIAARTNPRAALTFRYTVSEKYNNRANNMHGGAIAMAFDNFSSTAIILWAVAGAPPDSDLGSSWITSGVSRTLNVSYLRPVPVGSQVDIESEVISVGKTMALVKGEMRSAETGKVLATFEHHKVLARAPGPKM